jgi:hypothetical protein
MIPVDRIKESCCTRCRTLISEALRIAEQQTAEARKAKDAGDPEGEERLNEWSNTLHALQIIKKRGVPDSMNDEKAH